MSAIKGRLEYEKFKKGQNLTRKQAMLAHCYMCNGEEESRTDCLGHNSCPMYQYAHYGKKTKE